jgi:hypothetical protein
MQICNDGKHHTTTSAKNILAICNDTHASRLGNLPPRENPSAKIASRGGIPTCCVSFPVGAYKLGHLRFDV